MSAMVLPSTLRLGDFEVARLGFGAMRLPGPDVWGEPEDPARARDVLRRVVALGMNLIDSAWYYGPHVANRLIVETLYPYPEGLVIATKLGGTRLPDKRWAFAYRPEELRAPPHPHTRGDGLLVYVQPTAPLDQGLHAPPPLVVARRPPGGASSSRVCSACSEATMRGAESFHVKFKADSRYQSVPTLTGRSAHGQPIPFSCGMGVPTAHDNSRGTGEARPSAVVHRDPHALGPSRTRAGPTPGRGQLAGIPPSASRQHAGM